MIRIAKLTDYAIVLLTYFARDGAPQVRNARDLAVETHLPLPTVSKILKGLSRAGLLVSHRGVKGGFSLARPAPEISVAAIIAAIEGPIALTECSSSAPSLCDRERECPVRSNWRIINQRVGQALEELSLADMTRPLGEPCGARSRLSVVAGLDRRH